MVILVAIFLSFLLLLCHWRWTRNSPIRHWPLIGMLPGLIYNASNIHEFITKVLKKSGYTYVFKGPLFTSLGFVLTSDPANVHHIFSKNFENYPKGPEFKLFLEPVGEGIFIADGESWKFQRRLIQSLMKNKLFEHNLEKIILTKVENGVVPVLEHAIGNGIEVDMQEVFQRLTFDTICVLVLGYDPKCLTIGFPEVVYEKAFDDMEETSFRRHIIPENLWKLQRWFQIGQERKMSEAWKIFDEFLYERISSKREYLKGVKAPNNENVEYSDLLTTLMKEDELKDQPTTASPDKFLRDMAFSLIAAGRDTVGATLSWFLWLVATHPSIEEKIIQEIKANVDVEKDGKKLKIFGAKEVRMLNYLHGSLCETLRLYPAGPFEHKRSIDPDTLPSGHRISANTRILISLYSMGRMEEIWGKDYLEFKPERWISDKGGILHVPSYKFMAFVAGPRSCLGKNMAFIQMKMVACAILYNYHVHVVEGHHVTPSLSILLHMKHGLKVRVARRSF
ncbi:alkane hydroxylase MAH1-like [Tripterygium wilfordii]|uniref:alkane hydroxylase MAH1-like n=1 Tax=Tripterygium wilfordii TaxID=458696 RepID=UPI0018F80527|nr:alkane hydroxylase MAH1-like [Tripterygium wilfordii]